MATLPLNAQTLRCILSSEHAMNFAKLVNLTQQEFLATLVVAIHDPQGSLLRPDWARGF